MRTIMEVYTLFSLPKHHRRSTLIIQISILIALAMCREKSFYLPCATCERHHVNLLYHYFSSASFFFVFYSMPDRWMQQLVKLSCLLLSLVKNSGKKKKKKWESVGLFIIFFTTWPVQITDGISNAIESIANRQNISLLFWW